MSEKFQPSTLILLAVLGLAGSAGAQTNDEIGAGLEFDF